MPLTVKWAGAIFHLAFHSAVIIYGFESRERLGQVHVTRGLMRSQSSYLQELTSHEGRLRDCWQV